MEEDLIILVADKNMHFTLKGALSRHSSLGIRPIRFNILDHTGRDGGVRTNGSEVLKLERPRYKHAMLVLDYEGSGTKAADALSLEQELDRELQPIWGDAAKAIVIAPELDVWMWGSDNALSGILGNPSEGGIRTWLRSQGFKFTDTDKPERPKRVS